MCLYIQQNKRGLTAHLSARISPSPTCACHTAAYSVYAKLAFARDECWESGAKAEEKTCVRERKNTYQEMADTHLTCFLSARLLIRLSLPPRSMYLVFKRSHLTVVNTATEGKKKKKKEPASCSVSYLECFHQTWGEKKVCVSEMNCV